jgi:CelD/BcsL family acetyltransferase involved in cellulose biosynthesis
MIFEPVTDDRRFFGLKEMWNGFLSRSDVDSIFLTHQWFTSWWEAFGRKYSLLILIARDEKDNILGIAPLMKDGSSLRFLASREVTDYCDFITLPDSRREFFSALLDYLSSSLAGIEKLDLLNLAHHSPTQIALVETAEKNGFSCRRGREDVAPHLELPPSYELYLSGLSRKNRHELRRKLRRADELENLEMKSAKNADEASSLIDCFIDLHKRSCREKESFWKTEGMDDFFRSITLTFVREGWLKLDLLLSRNTPVSSLLGFTYGGTLYLYNIAFDDVFSRYYPGYYLLHEAVRGAIVRGRTGVDFLRGGERYKYEFGAKDREIFSLTIDLEDRKK